MFRAQMGRSLCLFPHLAICTSISNNMDRKTFLPLVRYFFCIVKAHAAHGNP